MFVQLMIRISQCLRVFQLGEISNGNIQILLERLTLVL